MNKTKEKKVKIKRLWLFCILIGLFPFTSHSNSAPKGPGLSADYLQALLEFEPWAETQWKDYPAIAGCGYFGDGATVGNGGIRGTSGIALAYAVLIREFPAAPERARRLSRLQATLRYVTLTHASGIPGDIAVDGKKWGATPGADGSDRKYWQTAEWAATMGFAAALLEKELPPELILTCKSVVAAESDFLTAVPPRSGYRLNSAGEENAWRSSIPVLAAAWMPDDPRQAEWLQTAKRYLANSYTVPADTTGPLKEWISTQTLFPSFAMENHKFYHPSYQMVAGMSLGDSYLMAAMLNAETGKEIAPFAEHNVQNVWGFIKDIILDSGEMIYPSGLDWSLHSFEHISYLAYISTHFKQPEAQQAERKLAKQLLLRQRVNANGMLVGESCANCFYAEAVVARRISFAFLHNRLANFASLPVVPLKKHVTHYPDVGLVVQRSDKALISVSYGRKVTALVYPLGSKTPAESFLTSPNVNSFIGGRGEAKLRKFKQTDDGFQIQLEFHDPGKTEMFIESSADAVIFVEMPTAAAATLKTDWYLMAVENHRLTGGKRSVFSEWKSAAILERSGAGRLTFPGKWLNIDDWIGMVAYPKGDFVYENAAAYNRTGAAEDGIAFRQIGEDRVRVMVVLPGKDAATTAAVAKSLKWKISGTVAKLTLKLPGAKKKVITVPLEKSNVSGSDQL